MSGEWEPAKYSLFDGERHEPVDDLIDLIGPIPSGRRCLDWGCGDGLTTARLHLQLRLDRTCGLDTDARMLVAANKLSVPGLVFEESDFADRREPVDLIFSNAAIQWRSGHERLLARAFENLGPGGQFVAQIPNNGAHSTHQAARRLAETAPYSDAVPSSESQAFQHTLDGTAYAQALMKAGFANMSVSEKIYVHDLSTHDRVIDWLAGTTLLHYKKFLDKRLYNQFLADLREVLPSSMPEPVLYWRRLLIWAQR